MGQIGVQMKAFIKYNKNIAKNNNTWPEVRPEVGRNRPNHAIKGKMRVQMKPLIKYFKNILKPKIF